MSCPFDEDDIAGAQIARDGVTVASDVVPRIDDRITRKAHRGCTGSVALKVTANEDDLVGDSSHTLSELTVHRPLASWRLRDLAHHDDLAAALDRFEYVERPMNRLGRRLVVILQEVDAVGDLTGSSRPSVGSSAASAAAMAGTTGPRA